MANSFFCGASWVDLGLSAVQAGWYAVLAVVAVPLRRLPAAPVWLAVAWVAMENIRTDWPAGGMPWGRLAYAVVGHPGVRRAALRRGDRGQPAAGAARRAAGRGVRRRGRARRRAAGAVVGVLALASCRWSRRTPPTRSVDVDVAAVQGNVPGNGTDVLRALPPDHRTSTRTRPPGWRPTSQRRAGAEARLRGLAGELHGRRPVRGPADAAPDIEAALDAIDVPILAGVVVDGGPEHVLNQGIVFDPVTGAGDRYTKWHPVPFGEYIPWRWLLRHPPRPAQPDPARHGARHPGRRRSTSPGTQVADAICFDVAYDDGLYAQLVPRRPAGRRADQQRDVHPHRPDRPAVRDQPAARDRDRTATSWWRPSTASPGVIAPDGSVVTSTRRPRTRSYVEAGSGCTTR